MGYYYNPAFMPYSPYNQGYFNQGFRSGFPAQPNPYAYSNPYAYRGRPPTIVVPIPASQPMPSNNLLWQGAIGLLGLGTVAAALSLLFKNRQSHSPHPLPPKSTPLSTPPQSDENAANTHTTSATEEEAYSTRETIPPSEPTADIEVQDTPDGPPTPPHESPLELNTHSTTDASDNEEPLDEEFFDTVEEESDSEAPPDEAPLRTTPSPLPEEQPTATEIGIEQARQIPPEQQIATLKTLFEQQTQGKIPSNHPVLVELRDQLQPDYGNMLIELRHLERIKVVRQKGIASHPTKAYQDKWQPFAEAGLLTEILDLESFKSVYRLQNNPAFQNQNNRQQRRSSGSLPLLRKKITAHLDRLQARQDNQSLLYTLGGFWRDNTLLPLNAQEQDLLRRLNKWLTKYPARSQT